MKWIKVEREPGLARVVFQMDRLDARVAEQVRAEITTALPRENLQVELDLSQVEFADSMGIGVFLMAFKLLPSGAPRMRLCGCRPQLRQVLDLVNLSHVCEISPVTP